MSRTIEKYGDEAVISTETTAKLRASNGIGDHKGASVARTRFQNGSVKKVLRGGELWWRGTYHPYAGAKRLKKREWLGKVSETTEKMARRRLQPFLDKVNDPGAVFVTASFQQAAEQWQSHVLPNHKPSTQSGCKSHLTHALIPYLGNKPLQGITGVDLQRFVTWLKENDYSPKSIRNIIATFRMIWNSTEMTHDPCRKLVLPEWNKEEQPYFTAEQMRSIIAAEKKEPYKTIWWLFSETGMRSGELFALRAEDVDVVTRRVHIRRAVWNGQIVSPKSRKGKRDPVLSAKLLAHLGPRLAVGGYLFPREAGEPMCADWVRDKYLKPLLKQLGIADAGFHAFRHGNSTLMEQKNVPAAVRMRRLGHADMDTTMGYTHAVDSDESRFADLVGDLLTEAIQ
jgi:integrase